MTVLLVDAANVVGARPDGWWRDRAGATTRLLRRLASMPGRTVTAPAGAAFTGGEGGGGGGCVFPGGRGGRRRGGPGSRGRSARRRPGGARAGQRGRRPGRDRGGTSR